MFDLTLIRFLNICQGHEFWYQSISHIRLPMLSIVTFALGCTVWPRYISYRRQTDRRNTVA